jgi:cell wall-associated NlpC family hydrolase
MSKWLITFLLAASTGAQAMPGAPAEEDMSRFMADQGLLTKLEKVGTKLEQVSTKLEQVGHTVSDRASDLVVTAMGFLGVPYKRGGNTAETGFDCSGIVPAMYEKTIGLVLPRRANEQAAATQAIDKKDLRPGDLVFFNTMKRAFSHVGIYVGEGKFIHSPKPGAQVRVEDMGQNYWQRRFDGARRVLSQAPAEPQATRQP